MDKIDKFTRRLNRDIAIKVLEELKNIRAGNTSHLDITKVGGEKSTYRVRLGSIRIQFVKTSLGNFVTTVGFKSNTTYRRRY